VWRCSRPSSTPALNGTPRRFVNGPPDGAGSPRMLPCSASSATVSSPEFGFTQAPYRSRAPLLNLGFVVKRHGDRLAPYKRCRVVTKMSSPHQVEPRGWPGPPDDSKPNDSRAGTIVPSTNELGLTPYSSAQSLKIVPSIFNLTRNGNCDRVTPDPREFAQYAVSRMSMTNRPRELSLRRYAAHRRF
jgi:hypothetical protein